MEENHNDHTPFFNYIPDAARKQEVRIAMGSAEESIRKLYEASKKGCIQTLKTLMEEDPHLVQKVAISSSNNESPLLHMSISHGHLEFTRLLLHHKPELAIEVDAFQRTPLHFASKHGDMETVRALLEKNTIACLVYDKNGLIPLHYAVINGQIEIMQELINARPQSVWMKLNDGRTILHLCVESNFLEGIKLLIETFMKHDEGFLNTIDDKGNTILDLSMTLKQTETVGYLLSIPKIKIANFTVSNATKESSDFQKTKTRNSRRQKREFSSSSTKKTRRCWKVLEKKLKYKGDWVEEVQGTMMLVATVIATVTFQAGVNPPGGVWQQDIQYNSSNYINNPYYGFNNLYGQLCNGTISAGTAIMACRYPSQYWNYLLVNTVSFLASTSVILLIISRFPLKNRVCSWLLAVAMCVAVVFLTFGYLAGVQMVNVYAIYQYESLGYVTAFVSWYGIIFLVGLYHIIRFVHWVVKSLLRRSHSSNDATP